MILKLLFILLQFTVIRFVACEISLFSIGAVGVVGSAIYYGKCYITECCDDFYIPGDFNKLEFLLDQNVYGQDLAKNTILTALKAHWNNPHAEKPLILSFHGPQGVGKNYVTKFIEESLYKVPESKYVHYFNGRIHFPLSEKVHQYQDDIFNWIKSNVSECGRQLFIFDEIDKMPAKVLDIMKPLVDYNKRLDNVDFRQCIFIFLSNTGTSVVVEEYLRLWRLGIKRKDIKLKDFEALIPNEVVKESGGLQHSDIIRNDLIDQYVPFLPLEKEHVQKCIVNQFKMRDVEATKDHIKQLMSELQWEPSPTYLFSMTGCKKINQLVSTIVIQEKS